MADKHSEAKKAYDDINEKYKQNKLDAQAALRAGDQGAYLKLTAEGKELEKQRADAYTALRDSYAQPDNRNLGQKGYPSTVQDADMHKPKYNIRDKGYSNSMDGTGAGGTPPAAAQPEAPKPETPAADNKPAAPAGNSSQPASKPAAQNQSTPTPDAMAGHYSRDPAQATNPPEADPNEEKKGIKYYAGKAINTLGKGFYDALANADSASFKRDVNAKLRGQPTGNLADVNAETARNFGRLYENDAANRNMEAQREQQEGERNPFHEAGKIAEYQQSAQNKQIQNNLAGGAGNKAFLQRTTVAPDVQGQKEYGANARARAAGYREKGDMRTRDAAGAYGESDAWKVTSRDYNSMLDESDRLAMGKGKNTEGGTTTETKQNPPAEETPAEEQPAAEQPAEEQNDENIAGDLQNVVNAVLGSSVRRVKCENGAGAGYRLQADGTAVRSPDMDEGQVPDNPPPYTPEMEQAVQRLAKSEKYGKKPGETDEQYKGRVNGELGRGGNRGTQAFSQNYGNTLEMGTSDTGSDENIKNIHRELSDFRMKCIKEDYDNYGEISPEDIAFVISKMGKKFTHGDKEYDFGSEEDWDDEDGSVLSGYAENIRNYVYNYKPEAQNIDPSIDPNEEHIGPMAQDIEKVNPACIKETPEGIKTVDTGRLALMNAGAIADLARRFDELEALIKNGR